MSEANDKARWMRGVDGTDYLLHRVKDGGNVIGCASQRANRHGKFEWRVGEIVGTAKTRYAAQRAVRRALARAPQGEAPQPEETV